MTLSLPYWIWSGRAGREVEAGGSGATTTSTERTARRTASRDA